MPGSEACSGVFSWCLEKWPVLFGEQEALVGVDLESQEQAVGSP